ncbi:MAG: hypothetical protein ABR878_17895 [Roseiarcus sp.]|jgi:hypothetical protein
MFASASSVAECLSFVGSAWTEFDLGNDISIIVTACGGRVFGPFLRGEDATGWISPAFASLQAFARLYGNRDWALGGERLWVSPELAYFVEDRNRYLETLNVPVAIDPGGYALKTSATAVELSQTCVHVRNGRSRQLRMNRAFSKRDAALWTPRRDVACAGYRQVVNIFSDDAATPAAPWIIRQIAPRGTVIVPVQPGACAEPFFGRAPQDRLRESNGAIRVAIDNRETFKIAIRARDGSGRIGYLRFRDQLATLLCYRFEQSAEGDYYDEPADKPGMVGFSSFVFQDDGAFGGYGEIEFVGRDLGIDEDGQRHGQLIADLWVAEGELGSVKALAVDEFGTDIADV